jgi:hypothetical protein
MFVAIGIGLILGSPFIYIVLRAGTSGDGMFWTIRRNIPNHKCPACGGRGWEKLAWGKCHACQGTGMIPQKRLD